MNFSVITEKVHRKDKSFYIDDNIDISDKEFSLPMPPKQFIMNQGALSPSCVSHAITMAVMVAINMKTNKWVQLSPFSMHALLNKNGGGTLTWYVAEILCRYGILPTSVFSARGDNPKLYEELQHLIKNNPLVEEIFGHYKGVAYAELDSFDDIKRALKAGYPVVGSVKAGRNFGYIKGGYEPVYPKSTTGYHEIEFNGWTTKDGKEYLIAINSHGTRSGDEGKVYIPRGRFIKDVALIDFCADHIKKKAKNIEFYIDATQFVVDGQIKSFEAPPYIKNNRTFVPVRFIAECLGANVCWNAIEGKATIESEEATIVLYTHSKAITVNGKTKKMDVIPEIVNGRMMIPIRYIAEALNCSVQWNADEQKAVITAL